jgi:hypothetical protein
MTRRLALLFASSLLGSALLTVLPLVTAHAQQPAAAKEP